MKLYLRDFLKVNLQKHLLILFVSLAALNGQPVLAASIEDLFVNPVKNLFEISESSLLENSQYDGTFMGRAIAKIEKRNLVNTQTHTEISVDLSAGRPQFILYYDDTAVAEKNNLIKDVALLTAISNIYLIKYGMKGNLLSYFNLSSQPYSDELIAELQSSHQIAEILINSKRGSPVAQARWLEIQRDVLGMLVLDPTFASSMNLSPRFLQDTSAEMSTSLEAARINAERHLRQRRSQWDRWKNESGDLDSWEAKAEKLNDLILKNDRREVRRMLESYLPWPLMEPIETAAWRQWLEAIEHPDWTKTTVAMRGVDYETDKMQRRTTVEGEKLGFMSTLLTLNQGSYTRRLRSLATSREARLRPSRLNLKPVTISRQMLNHSADPMASNYISFTLNPKIATRFVGHKERAGRLGGGLLTVRMDSRRLVPNLASRHQGELEFLAPLIVFPDEVIKYHEGSLDSDKLSSYLKDVHLKTGVQFELDKNPSGSALAEFKEKGSWFFNQFTSESFVDSNLCSKSWL